jgi:hypothetical protein
MRKIKTKKASLLLESETVKIVLAVICLCLLIFLAYKLYTLFMKKTAIEIARENIEQLVNKINKLEEGQSGKFTLTGPNDWYLMLFNKGDPMPVQCANAGNCLCICEAQTYEGCDKQGICKSLNLESQMSYTCFASSITGVDYVYKCFKIKIQDIILNKNNGAVYIGDISAIGENSVGKRFSDVLKIVDENGNSVENLIFQYIGNKDENLRLSTKKLIRDYLKENVAEIYDWELEVSLNGQIVAAFIQSSPPLGWEGPYIAKFSNNFEKEIENSRQKYLFKFMFNLK